MREQSSARKWIYKISKNFRVETKKKVQRLMGRIYEPLLVPKPIRILCSTCTSLSDARGASERFKSVGEAQPTEKGTLLRALFCWLGWPDLNRRVPESKSGALPLGDIPITHTLYHAFCAASSLFFENPENFMVLSANETWGIGTDGVALSILVARLHILSTGAVCPFTDLLQDK